MRVKSIIHTIIFASLTSFEACLTISESIYIYRQFLFLQSEGNKYQESRNALPIELNVNSEEGCP